MNAPYHYSPVEESANIISHVIGLGLSLIGGLLLWIRANQYGDIWQLVSVSIFAASLVCLYAASALYHSAREPVFRKKLRVFDHAAIYILIAGTYTPFSLVTLHGRIGWVIFSVAWGMAVTGVILKVFFTGRFNLLSTLMYLLMGWIIIFAIEPLTQNLSKEGLNWLFAGGVAYTVGAMIYSIKKIPFNHAIFHLFVLLGSFCHFVAVYFWVLPTGQAGLFMNNPG